MLLLKSWAETIQDPVSEIKQRFQMVMKRPISDGALGRYLNKFFMKKDPKSHKKAEYIDIALTKEFILSF